MNDNELLPFLKAKSADELMQGASSDGVSIYGWVFLLLLLIVVAIGIYKIFKDK